MSEPSSLAVAVALAASICAAATERRRRRELRRVARACHELRGPLGAVGLGLAAERRTGGVSGQRLQALELELGRAVRALEDLADLPSVPGPVSIEALLADSVEAWRPAAGGRQLRHLPGDPAVVWADRSRLAQAIGNLITNAIEHGGGPIDVRARVWDGVVRIEVIDGGAGLSAPLAMLVGPRRGQRPLRGRARAGRPARGRGYGLSIAAEVAAGYGGRLRSAPSQRGARLVLELPLAASGAPAGTDADLGAVGSASRRPG